jgi:hypothetical protein
MVMVMVMVSTSLDKDGAKAATPNMSVVPGMTTKEATMAKEERIEFENFMVDKRDAKLSW